MSSDVWKLQDAKARFSEVVRRARAGEPQRVTLHGRDAVIVIDPQRFNVTPKPAAKPMTGRDFVEASKKYRGIADQVEFSRRGGMIFRDRSRNIFDREENDERKS